MQTPVEPFMQPGVQETYTNILLSTLLSLLALAKGKVLAQKKRNHTEERKIHKGQMSWVGHLPGLFHKQDAHTQTGSSLPILQKHMKTETNPTTRASTSGPWEYKRLF